MVQRRKILIINDKDSNIKNEFSREFSDAKCITVQSKNITESIEEFEKVNPDLTIIDNSTSNKKWFSITQPSNELLYEIIDPTHSDLYLETLLKLTTEINKFYKYEKEMLHTAESPIILESLDILLENARMLRLPSIAKPMNKLQRAIHSNEDRNIKLELLENIHDNSLRLEEALAERKERHPDDNLISEKPLKGKKILIVEDLKTNAIIVKKFLEFAGATSEIAENGKIGVEYFENRGPYDLVLMDLTMPVMDGYEATEIIRSKDSEIPIVACTALAMREDKARSFNAGCTGYIQKPVHKNILVNTCMAELEKINKSSSRQHSTSISVSHIDSVLLATPNSILASYISEYLKTRKIETIWAKSGDEAIKLCTENKDILDIVFIDDSTTQRTWSEVAKFASSLNAELPVIVLAGDKTKNFRVAFANNCYSIIPKPIKFSSFEHILSDITNEMKTTLENQRAYDGTSTLNIVNSDKQPPASNFSLWQKSFLNQGGDSVFTLKFNEHGKYGYMITDVAGHDTIASHVASWLMGLINGTWKLYPDPLEFLKFLDSQKLPDSIIENRYFCALVLIHDPIKEKLYYANAGIPPGYILDTSNHENSKWIEWEGNPVGLFDEGAFFDTGELSFNKNNRLFLATDAILESLPEDIVSLISKNQSQKDIQDAVKTVAEFCERSMKRDDDVSIIGLDGFVPPHGKNLKRISLLSTFEEIDTAMLEIDKHLTDSFQNVIDIDLVSMAIRESLLNAAEHGNNAISSKHIYCDIVDAEDKIQIKVSDEGQGFNYKNIKKDKIDKLYDIDKIQNRGMEIIDHIVSDIHNIGSTLILCFDKKKE